MTTWPTKTIQTYLGPFLVHDDYQAELLTTNGYELEVELMARMMVEPGMTVANIGANVGWFTRLLSNLVGPEGEVHAVEPHPDNVELLRQNVNGNVLIYQCALGVDSPGTAELGEHPVNSGEHSLLIHTDTSVTVQLADAHEILPKLDFAIIDTQGFDLPIMVALGDKRPPKAIVEWWQDGCDYLGITKTRAYEMYKEMGYEIAPLGDDMNIYLAEG